jgi:protease-4
MLPRIIATIFNGVWLIDPAKAEGYYPVIMSFLEGKFKADEYKKSENDEYNLLPTFVNEAGVKVLNETWQFDSAKITDENTTVIIPIIGAISKYDYCGDAGSNTISSFLKAAANNPNVKGIIFHIDSPGGEVDGTENLVNTIKSLDKPTVAWVDGMAASAAYWIASACDKIIANIASDIFGSIGVYVTFADFSKYYEERGIKIHEVYSNFSTEKNQAWKEGIKGNYDKIKENLDLYAQNFINGVKSNRAGKLNFDAKDDPFKGKVFFADKALEIGLIDEIGAFDSAYAAIEKLGNDENSGNMIIKKEKFDAAIEAAKIQGASEAQARITELEGQISEYETEAESQTNELQGQLDTANTNISNLQEENKKLKEKVAELTGKIPTTALDNKGDNFEEGKDYENDSLFD